MSKVSQYPSRIVGVALKEISVNLLSQKSFAMAKFGLLQEEGYMSGSLVMEGPLWNEKMQQALATFIEALEEEAVKHIFKAPEEQASAGQEEKESSGPPQF